MATRLTNKTVAELIAARVKLTLVAPSGRGHALPLPR